MLSYASFTTAVQAGVPSLAASWIDPEQEAAVSAAHNSPVFIVAGPGAGKTTALTLRILKLILVDGVAPEGILATTFTRKAAEELRSRILSWGYASIAAAARAANDPAIAAFLNALDINRVAVGTLDSLAEQFLVDNRPAGAITPATIEAFLARGLLRRHALFPNGRFRDPQLAAHLGVLAPHFPYATAFSSKLDLVAQFADRARHDQIDLNAYGARGVGERILVDTVNDYYAYLAANHLADYGRLEELFLDALRQGHMRRVTDSLKALLVDEFQDTNYLQEQIYLELCRQSNASLTVVGDDDQSIYRFRGATVEIFAAFQTRLVSALGNNWTSTRIDLYRNYRSTGSIVAFCDAFIQIEPTYQPARVAGKLRLVARANRLANAPVLGMFRQDRHALAVDLSAFLIDVFRGNGRIIPLHGAQVHVARGANGDFGDSVFLGSKVRERRNDGTDRLPLLLRRELIARNVRVFNPRGRSLGDIPEIQLLLGLSLECIDPGGRVQATINRIGQAVGARLNNWRQSATALVRGNNAPVGLAQFVANWGARRQPQGMRDWPRDWPLLELIFTLTTWFPFLQEDPEGQVYLEAVARTVAEVGQMGTLRARILHGQGQYDDASVFQAIRSVFESIADESVDVDEEIMPRVPRNYFPMMTVHQAKGLEFPLVIMDVGSDYRTNHHQQKRFRFPDRGDNVHVQEDDVAAFSPVGPMRTQRAAVDRAWDDIRRLHFVGFSRPHDVLLVVGLTTQLSQTPVRGIATGDLRGGTRALTFVPAANWDQNSPNAVSTVALI